MIQETNQMKISVKEIVFVMMIRNLLRFNKERLKNLLKI